MEKVIQRVECSQKLLTENSGECPPRSGGWRVSLRRGRVFSYLAAYMLGLVCHIGDSGVAGNQLRCSRMLEFLAVLILLVPCTNLLFLGPSRIFGAATPSKKPPAGVAAPTYPERILSGFAFGSPADRRFAAHSNIYIITKMQSLEKQYLFSIFYSQIF